MSDQLIGSIVIYGSFATIAAYPFLQILALWRLRGLWRLAALMPLALAAYVSWLSYQGYLKSANLWPVPLIFGSWAVTMFLIVLLLVWRSVAARR
jgi:hypothetical protein